MNQKIDKATHNINKIAMTIIQMYILAEKYSMVSIAVKMQNGQR